MYDGPKIIIGIIIFLGVVTFPFYYNAYSSSVKGNNLMNPSELKGGDNDLHPPLPGEKKQRTLKDMRSNHMKILYKWRDQVIRHDDRKSGKGLQLSCTLCHARKQENVIKAPGMPKISCEGCHSYTGVQLYCWDCHFDSKEKSK